MRFLKGHEREMHGLICISSDPEGIRTWKPALFTFRPVLADRELHKLNT
jgi:hypothetical protein